MFGFVSAKRHLLILECIVHILESTSDVRHPFEFVGHCLNHPKRYVVSLSKGNTHCEVEALGCQLCEEIGVRVYTLPNIPNMYYNCRPPHTLTALDIGLPTTKERVAT